MAVLQVALVFFSAPALPISLTLLYSMHHRKGDHDRWLNMSSLAEEG